MSQTSLNPDSTKMRPDSAAVPIRPDSGGYARSDRLGTRYALERADESDFVKLDEQLTQDVGKSYRFRTRQSNRFHKKTDSSLSHVNVNKPEGVAQLL